MYICNLLIIPEDLVDDEKYMQRCIELARKGAGSVSPNPMVGALLVHDGKIIGEGWHQKYGEAHAEVNCINDAVYGRDPGIGLNALHGSTLYVSLEPCAHFGKTPPCTDLIIKHKIPRVVIGCRDPFKQVNGKGIEKLKEAGVEVELGVLEQECMELNKGFFTFHTFNRPYVILKWAQSADGFIAGTNGRTFISNAYTNRLVHQWRSEESAILVGTNTAFKDDPQLTTRLWTGSSAIRLVIDMDLKLPANLNIFNGNASTVVFNRKKHEKKGEIFYYQLKEQKGTVEEIINAIYELGIQSVIVEGGAKLLQSFIDDAVWDEIRVITNRDLTIENGVPAPGNFAGSHLSDQFISNDKIEIFKNLNPMF